MLDCSLAKCGGGDKQRVVFQALGDTTRFYCADTATGNPVTAPAGARVSSTPRNYAQCRCNAQGRAPELVFERLNGNSICYCKGEEGKTISEVCAGPLPSAGESRGKGGYQGRRGEDGRKPHAGHDAWRPRARAGPKAPVDGEQIGAAAPSPGAHHPRRGQCVLQGNALGHQGAYRTQVKADKNSADLIHAIDAKGCGHSIAEYSNEVKQALERRQQCVAEVKAREVKATAVQRSSSSWSTRPRLAFRRSRASSEDGHPGQDRAGGARAGPRVQAV